VGLDNYSALFGNEELRRTFLTTAVFGLLCVAATMLVGLGVALLLDQPFRGRRVLGVLVLLPWAIPRVAAGVVWRWMFDAEYGLINWLLPGADRAWFNHRLSAFVAIGIVVVWQSFPFVALSLLAGLQSIPPDVREAARVDGAVPLQALRHVILPMLKPLIVTLVVISTIWDFKIFDQVFVMTGGGPAKQTELVTLTVYREAFARAHLGSAAAMAFALFAVLLVLTLLYTRTTRSDEVAARA
jgi:ABC-type sugar transport system permease subunit